MTINTNSFDFVFFLILYSGAIPSQARSPKCFTKDNLYGMIPGPITQQKQLCTSVTSVAITQIKTVR